MSQGAFAGYLAALYGDSSDPEFQAQDLWRPSVEQLEEAHCAALKESADDAATAIAAELRRHVSDGIAEVNPAALFGSKAGLWRLH